jgi:hypothetical protein
MTVGIAAITGSGDHIVVVSDRMISSGGIIQAADHATLKQRKIAKAWGLIFSATDSNLFLPIVNAVVGQFNDKTEYDLVTIQDAIILAYQNLFDSEFTSTYLSRYNIASINTFMNIGLAQFGLERFSQICDQIASFDLGIDLLGYGFDTKKTPHIFEVNNPGKIINHDLLGYAVTGSGSWMATAALRRKKMPYDLAETAYRVLDAKFSAETAPGVGRSTSIFTLDKNGQTKSIGYGSHDKIKEIWEKTVQIPEPKKAIEIISKSLV